MQYIDIENDVWTFSIYRIITIVRCGLLI